MRAPATFADPPPARPARTADPENPVPASEVYDPAENTNDFTRGVFGARYGDDGFWYVYEQDGEDGVHAEFHQLKAVPCDMPEYCLDYMM